MERYWETGKCPRCGAELESGSHKEYRDSSVLLQFWEPLTTWRCSKCNWSSEKY